MKVHNVEMIMSAVRPEQYPTEGTQSLHLLADQMLGNHHLSIK